MKTLREMSPEERRPYVDAFYIHDTPIQRWNAIDECWEDKRAGEGFLHFDGIYRLTPKYRTFGELSEQECMELVYGFIMGDYDIMECDAYGDPLFKMPRSRLHPFEKHRVYIKVERP